MEYSVDYRIQNGEQYAGNEVLNKIRDDPEIAEADTAEMAVDITIDYLLACAINFGEIAERNENTLTIYDDNGNVKEYYHDFRARAITNN